jgi:hypothetical protein
MTTTVDQGEIKVAGDAAYESEVSRIVTNIFNTQTGRAIATKILAHGEVIITDDYPGIDTRDINAEFDPAKSKKNLGVIPFHPHNKRLNTQRVFLNGNEITVGQLRTIQQHYAGQKPDEILCHELVHAARYLGGDFKQTPIPTMPAYENEEEYYAILITNVYISEKRRSFESFRKSHHLRPKPEMTEEEAEPWVFLLQDDNYRLIEKFWKQHPTIAPMIAKAPAKFNPIRDYDEVTRGALPPIRVKDTETVSVPIRITQQESRVPLTDYYLITLLEPRYRADDVVGYGGRARKLEQVFGTLLAYEALPLMVRLLARAPGDKVAMYFHDHLATATRNKLFDILKGAAARK